MGFFESVGKIVGGFVIILLVVAFLAYFGIIGPAKSSTQEINMLFEAVNTEVGRHTVYLDANRFDDAKNSLLQAKLKLSDLEVKLGNSKLSSADKEDYQTLAQAYRKLIDGLDNYVEFRRIEVDRDILTADKYAIYVENYIKARNNYAEFYNLAMAIKNEQMKQEMNLSHVRSLIDIYDAKIADMQSNDTVRFVYANTFISKIEPTNKDVRDVALNIEKQFGTDADSRVQGIIDYFSKNLNYIHIPNWNPGSNVQFIQSPDVTLSSKGGNCADMSILFDSLAESIGMQTQFCFVDTKHSKDDVTQNPSLFSSDHTAVSIFDGETWFYYDVTCFAGIDLETGYQCNQQSFEYASECFEVEKFFEAVKKNVQTMNQK